MQDTVRDKLKNLKENIGITYKAMAANSGVSYTTMKNFMAGRDVKESTLVILHDYAVEMEQKFNN